MTVPQSTPTRLGKDHVVKFIIYLEGTLAQGCCFIFCLISFTIQTSENMKKIDMTKRGEEDLEFPKDLL